MSGRFRPAVVSPGEAFSATLKRVIVSGGGLAVTGLAQRASASSPFTAHFVQGTACADDFYRFRIATPMDIPCPSQVSRRRFWWLVLFFIVTTLLVGWVTDERTGTLLRNTFRLALGTSIIALPIGLGLATYITRTDLPGRRVVLLLLAIQLFMPLYLQTAGWQAGFGQQGWWHATHLTMAPLLEGWRGAIWVHGVAAIPWVTLIMSVSLTLVNPQWEELAQLEGSGWQVFTRVTLPQCVPAIMVSGIFILITTSGEITVTDVYSIRTYAEEIYIGFARDLPPSDGTVSGNPGDGPITSILMPLSPLQVTVVTNVLIVGWLTLGALIVWNWQSGLRLADPFGGHHRWPRPFSPGRARWPILAVAWSVLLLITTVPLGNLIWKLGIHVQQQGDERVRTWQLAKACELMLQAPFRFDQELGWTLATSQLSALMAILLAIPLVWAALRHRLLSGTLVVLVTVSLAVPGPVVAMALIRIFNQPNHPWVAWLYDRTILVLCIGMLVRSFPWIVLILWTAFRTIPMEWSDAARMENVGVWRQLVRLVIPNRAMALACCWFVALALTAGELTTSILLIPPGITTLAIRIFNLIHYGVEDRLAALCLWSILLFIGFALPIVWWLRRSLRSALQ